jgi:peptidoglycan hydrolase CwlO-like protein
VCKSEGNRTKTVAKTAVLISSIIIQAGDYKRCLARHLRHFSYEPSKCGWVPGKKKRTGKGRIGKQDEEIFGISKKTARLPELEKETGREREKIHEKLEEMKEEIKEMRKENQEVKREIEQLREEFKNRERNGRKRKTCLRE